MLGASPQNDPPISAQLTALTTRGPGQSCVSREGQYNRDNGPNAGRHLLNALLLSWELASCTITHCVCRRPAGPSHAPPGPGIGGTDKHLMSWLPLCQELGSLPLLSGLGSCTSPHN